MSSHTLSEAWAHELGFTIQFLSKRTPRSPHCFCVLSKWTAWPIYKTSNEALNKKYSCQLNIPLVWKSHKIGKLFQKLNVLKELHYLWIFTQLRIVQAVHLILRAYIIWRGESRHIPRKWKCQQVVLVCSAINIPVDCCFLLLSWILINWSNGGFRDTRTSLLGSIFFYCSDSF